MYLKKSNYKLLIYLLVLIITFNSVIINNYFDIPDSPKQVEAIEPITTTIVLAVLVPLGVYAGKKIIDYIANRVEDKVVSDYNLKNYNWQELNKIATEANLWAQAFDRNGKVTGYDISPEIVVDVMNFFDEAVEQEGFFYAYSDDPLLPESFDSLDEYNSYIDNIKQYNIVGQNDMKYVSDSSYRKNIYSLPDDLNFILRKDYIGVCSVYIIDTNWNTTFPTVTLNTGSQWTIKNTDSFTLKKDSELLLDRNYRIQNSSFITSLVPEQFIVWRTLADFKNFTGGILPYYTSDKYDPNYTPSGFTTVTTKQLEDSIVYGDIVDYITNNSGVTHNDVYYYINNYGTTGGGGSGSGGSGNNSGGINLDFLGSLGKLLASIINGIGNMINELLTGIIDTVTKIVDNLGKLLSGVVNIIPESFTALINAVFSWLPEELRVLIVSSVTLMILVGIIKLIRGS